MQSMGSGGMLDSRIILKLELPKIKYESDVNNLATWTEYLPDCCNRVTVLLECCIRGIASCIWVP